MRVFISGATGYLGRSLTASLLASGHEVRALVRPGSERKLPAGAHAIAADPFHPLSFQDSVEGCDTFVHLLGTPKPSPWKGEQFRTVDRRSLIASVDAAKRAGIAHFVYVSVAHPAPIMRDYIAVRRECEQYIRDAGLHATILRPWYVLGPGHNWPRLLQPLYAAAKLIPAWRESAQRLSLLTLPQMIGALHWAVEHPSRWRVLTVDNIRSPAAGTCDTFSV